MSAWFAARLVLAEGPGLRLLSAQPEGIELVTHRDIAGVTLAPPFDAWSFLPETSRWGGDIVGVACGATFDELDSSVFRFGRAEEGTREGAAGVPAAGEVESAEEAFHVVKGTYRTALELHHMDAPPWVEAYWRSTTPVVRATTQWPEHVAATVARAFPAAAPAEVEATPLDGTRDAALVLPTVLAVLALAASSKTERPIRLIVRRDQRFITGGRPPTYVTLTSLLDDEERPIAIRAVTRIDTGGIVLDAVEREARVRHAVVGPYAIDVRSCDTTFRRVPSVPFGAFEGYGAPIDFARETHMTRLALLAGRDPIDWRRANLVDGSGGADRVLTLAAESSDFHRRYAANDLVRSRDVTPTISGRRRGIGVAVALQPCGRLISPDPCGVTVRVESGGRFVVTCSLPTPTPRLHLAWRQLVATELGVEVSQVELHANAETSGAGARFLSRGVSLVPRAIISACRAVRDRRFRDPLPIQARRSVRRPEQNESAGAAVVEAAISAATFDIEVRRVTLAVAAGRILDRGAAEAELRRGVHHALAWALASHIGEIGRIHESAQRRRDAARVGVPAVRIVFAPGTKRDGPLGLGELPFRTVPAALASAISQASGLYLDELPVRPADLLAMTQGSVSRRSARAEEVSV